MAKKTTKAIDQRKTCNYYNETRDDFVKDTCSSVVSKLAKGFMDYRNLVKPVNAKLANTIEMAIEPVRIYNDDGKVSVNMFVESIHYSRNGFVVRYGVEIDNRVIGSFSKFSDMGVYEFSNRVMRNRKPNVYDVIYWIINNMFDEVEDKFNEALFDANLAPSKGPRYDEDYDD